MPVLRSTTRERFHRVRSAFPSGSPGSGSMSPEHGSSGTSRRTAIARCRSPRDWHPKRSGRARRPANWHGICCRRPLTSGWRAYETSPFGWAWTSPDEAAQGGQLGKAALASPAGLAPRLFVVRQKAAVRAQARAGRPRSAQPAGLAGEDRGVDQEAHAGGDAALVDVERALMDVVRIGIAGPNPEAGKG